MIFYDLNLILKPILDFSLIKAGFVDNIIINHCKFPGFFCRLIFKFRLVKIVTNKNYLSLFGNVIFGWILYKR